jgi:uncharacterized protein (DUF58 family)
VTIDRRTAASPALPHQGPGDLTLASIVLFTLGAYGVAAGAATGEEAVVAVGVFAFTLFVIGIVWPVASLSRLEVDVVAPPDATVGDTVPLRVTVRGRAPRLDLRVLDPAGEWFRTAAPTAGTILHAAQRRGVFHYVRVQLRTSAPLGVFVRTRTLRVELAFPTTVAPRAHTAPPVLQPIPDRMTLTTVPAFAGGSGDTVRAVRPYVPGDPARLVHWPTSARRGELVVREFDPPPALGIALVVDLRGNGAEAAASRAMGIGQSTLLAGGVVCCCTFEDSGPVAEIVSSVQDLGRQLARAIPGPPGEPLPGWPVEVVRP